VASVAGDAADGFVDLLHGRAAADDGVLGALPGFAVHGHGGSHEAAGFQRMFDVVQHVGDIERLEHIIESAHLGGLNGGFGGAVRRS
jgi:hypothetical protein